MMAGAEYVKHVKGDKLKKGMVLVFQDYYEVLGDRKGYEEHTFRGDTKPTRVGVRFAVTAYNRDGSGRTVKERRYNLAVDYPAGKLIKG